MLKVQLAGAQVTNTIQKENTNLCTFEISRRLTVFKAPKICSTNCQLVLVKGV